MQLIMNVKYDIKWPKALLEKRTQPMIDIAGNEIVRSIRQNIINQISITGGRFRKLKPATIKSKKGRRYPSKALYAAGILYRSIHYFKGHRPNIGTVGIKKIGKPLRRNVAEWQQTGAYRGGVARRFFGISKQLRQKITSMMNGWLRNTMRHVVS